MKLLLLHISDIHFFQGENQILNKKKAIVDVLKNYFSDVKHCESKRREWGGRYNRLNNDCFQV